MMLKFHIEAELLVGRSNQPVSIRRDMESESAHQVFLWLGELSDRLQSSIISQKITRVHAVAGIIVPREAKDLKMLPPPKKQASPPCTYKPPPHWYEEVKRTEVLPSGGGVVMGVRDDSFT